MRSEVGMSALFLIVGIAFVLALFPLAFVIVRRYVKARGTRVIICPETVTPETVEVDAAHAAWTGAISETSYRLTSCSRWPERQDCGRDCLAQIESAPDGCLVRERVGKWYEGSFCAICGASIPPPGPVHPGPGLLDPHRQPCRWQDVAPEDLWEVFATYRPLCSDCLAAETFRTRFPDRVVDDPRPPVYPSPRRSKDPEAT